MKLLQNHQDHRVVEKVEKVVKLLLLSSTLHKHLAHRLLLVTSNLIPEFDMYTNEIKISGKKDIVNTRPRANINYNNGTF